VVLCSLPQKATLALAAWCSWGAWATRQRSVAACPSKVPWTKAARGLTAVLLWTLNRSWRATQSCVPKQLLASAADSYMS